MSAELGEYMESERSPRGCVSLRRKSCSDMVGVEDMAALLDVFMHDTDTYTRPQLASVIIISLPC